MDALKRLISRWFPALENNEYAPKLGRVVHISDALVEEGATCTYDRPYYAVDIQPIDEHFNDQGPVWRDVVCSLPYAGQAQGLFGLPEAGTIIEYTQSYCLPHLIHVRGVIPWGLALPPLNTHESRWQQSNQVYQGYDQDGNWHRVTKQNIKERCEQVHESTAKLKQVIKVDEGGKVWLGNNSDNVLQILSDFMQHTSEALTILATHTHAGPPPDQEGDIAAKASNIESDNAMHLTKMTE